MSIFCFTFQCCFRKQEIDLVDFDITHAVDYFIYTCHIHTTMFNFKDQQSILSTCNNLLTPFNQLWLVYQNIVSPKIFRTGQAFTDKSLVVTFWGMLY